MRGGFLEQTEIDDLIQYIGGNMDPTKIADFYFFFLMKKNPMLYGTGDAQACYLRAEDVVNQPPKNLDTDGIKHAMNGISIGGKTQYPRVSNYWLEQVQGKTSAIQGQKAFTVNNATTTGKDKQEFWDRFDASKLSIAAMPVTKTQAAPKAAQSKSTDPREIIYDNLIRRSCKFLLYDAIDKNKPVAYALDELDLSKVAYLVAGGQYPLTSRARWDDSAKAIVSDTEAKIPVCSSELRELFRYWDYFNAHIVFFKGFWKVKAPWEEGHYLAQWAAYAQHRAQKLAHSPGAAKVPKFPDKIKRCVDETDPAAAIGFYHALQPSKLTGRGMQIHGVGTQSETLTADHKGRGRRGQK